MHPIIRRVMLVIGCGWLLGGPCLDAQGQPPRAILLPPVTREREEAPEKEEPGEQEREEEEPIETDRDSFTPATKTVSKGRFIVESAYSFIDNRRGLDTHSFPELLLRYGVTDRIEVRLGWSYEVGGAGNEISGNQAEEESFQRSGVEREHNLAYGTKVEVTRQNGWLPQSALLVMAFTPTGGESNDTQAVGTYVFGWTLPNRWKADAALRYATGSEEGDRFDILAPSVVLRVPVGEKWNVHGEYFGLFSRDRATDFVRHYLSPGVHYLVNNNLEVGVRVGWGLNDQSARFFCNVGGGWRF
ncbi:MAG: transporter [Gemmataceae bacterium]|nr:transporter [Gemmataceae bacterium]